jgi:hypothetical protein
VKKAAAYGCLIEKLKVIEPDASRESVVKKNNNLRSTFRKELKKVNDSKRSGASGDDVYAPSLWFSTSCCSWLIKKRLTKVCRRCIKGMRTTILKAQ